MPLDVEQRPTPAAAADIGTPEEILEESGYERRGDYWICPDFVAVERHGLAVAV